MIFRGSRYESTPVLSEPVRSLAARPIPQTPATLEHVVMLGERLDHLATRFYGDPTRSWLILDANPAELDPFRLLTPGRRIQVPREGTSR